MGVFSTQVIGIEASSVETLKVDIDDTSLCQCAFVLKYWTWAFRVLTLITHHFASAPLGDVS